MVMSGQSVYLTTLSLGRLRPLKQLISTKCPYFYQLLTASFCESVEGKLGGWGGRLGRAVEEIPGQFP